MKRNEIEALRRLYATTLPRRRIGSTLMTPLEHALVLQEGLRLAVDEVAHYRQALKRAFQREDEPESPEESDGSPF